MRTNHLHIALLCLFILGARNYLHSQSTDQNYITSRTYRTDTTFQYRVQYYDAIGRPSELIQVGGAPSGKNLVTFQQYDQLCRESKTWLPIPTKTNSGDYIFLNDLSRYSSIFYKDTTAYSQFQYEASPLNRVTTQYGPGEIWHNRNHKIENNYLSSISKNDMLSCELYTVNNFNKDSTLTLTRKELDCTGMFRVFNQKGEDGEITLKFVNEKEQTILTRQVNTLGQDKTYHDTYYVYDFFGNLRVVLPPSASELLKTGISWSSVECDTLKKYAYLYNYDSRNRCIAQKKPGCNWSFYMYDRADNLIFSQDGVQRNQGEWTINIPDVFGRICLTGIYKSKMDPFNNTIKSFTARAVRIENGQYMGYTITGFPVYSKVTLLSVNYYDDYTFLNLNHFTNQKQILLNDTVNGFKTHCTATPQGMLTGKVNIHLNSDSIAYKYSAYYYDNRERLTQVNETNHLGGYDKKYMSYNLAGDMTHKKQIHCSEGIVSQTEDLTYAYDTEGRLLTVTHQLKDSDPVILVTNKYDEIGRMASNNHNNIASLTTEYEYNIRSWITNINNPLFNQTLYYTDGMIPCFNGNISKMTWKSDGTIKGYQFMYDSLNRFLSAWYGEDIYLSTNKSRFNEQVGKYDKQGNILQLKRYGATTNTTYRPIDDLTLNYNGNQLIKVTDNATNPTRDNEFNFKDDSNEEIEYEYDANGNLTKDLNKKIADIQYNYLNLPSRIEFENGDTISYLYTSDGIKLRTKHTINNCSTITDYCGNVIYENGIAKSLLTSAGYVSLADGKHHYYIKDHQGNNRVVADENGNVEERNDYYPFGGLMASSTSSVQPYKYNGKELDSKGGLDWYDYGARHYDTALGRWHVMDPMSEKYYSISPYAYCANNPVRFIDPEGSEVKPIGEEALKMIQNTLTNDDIKFVQINKEGLIDKDLINSHKSESNNFNSLLELVNSDYLINVETGVNYSLKNNEGMEEHDNLTYIEPDTDFVDPTGSTPNGTTTGETGRLGITLLPGKGTSGVNSINNSIKVMIHSNLSDAGKAEMYSHEANGHALMYIRTGDRVQSAHHYKGLTDTNIPLKNMIIKSKTETVTNMKSR